MSAAYHYVNHSKKQYFRTGLFCHADSWKAMGTAPGARAVTLLLSENGLWYNDRLSVVRDSAEEYSVLSIDYLNIEIDAELMLLDIDGFERYQQQLERCFDKVCEFALILQCKDAEDWLNQQFGKNKWQNIYNSKTKNSNNHIMQKIIDYQQRKLQLYKLP